jgi:uncharacterized protein YqeY
MTIKELIEQDLKKSLLAGDASRTSVLRGLKSAISYEELAKGLRDKGLDEAATIDVLAKEAKKRQESADLYKQGGDESRAQQELSEKVIIDSYLPAPLSDEELQKLVDETVQKLGASPQNMGQIIASIKAAAGGTADGAAIAKLVKERLAP